MYYKMFFFLKKSNLIIIRFYPYNILYITTFTLFNKKRNNLLNIRRINALKVVVRKIFHAELSINEKLNKFDFLCKSKVVYNTVINVCKIKFKAICC